MSPLVMVSPSVARRLSDAEAREQSELCHTPCDTECGYSWWPARPWIHTHGSPY